jgi:hypothetical protein
MWPARLALGQMSVRNFTPRNPEEWTNTAQTVKLIFSFLLSSPVAGLLKRVPDARPAYKNLFVIR